MRKRWFDLLVALLLLLVLSPVLLLTAILVRVKLGAPVLFRQERAGLFGAPFFIYKFRSMTDARDANGDWLPDEVRLTAFGRFLRSSSLDELPQLFNVIKGELSLVGPRPLYVSYIPLYSPEQARRLEVKPGITGWAQVHGRNAISWEEKFRLDVWYVDHATCLLDLKILALTARKIFIQEGIHAQNHSTMSVFTGSQAEELR